MEPSQTQEATSVERPTVVGDNREDSRPNVAGEEQKNSGGVDTGEKSACAKKILRLLTLAAVLQVGKSEDPSENGEREIDGVSFGAFMVAYTVMVMAISI